MLKCCICGHQHNVYGVTLLTNSEGKLEALFCSRHALEIAELGIYNMIYNHPKFKDVLLEKGYAVTIESINPFTTGYKLKKIGSGLMFTN
jgi:hypothetical protein